MNVSLSCRNTTAAYSGKLSDRPITEFVGPGSAPGSSRYCRPAYVAPQSAPSPRLRTVPAMRPARPDASMTRSAFTTVDPILTPTARVRSTQHLVDVPGDDAHAWFGGGTAPQFALEHHSAAVQRRRAAVVPRRRRHRGAGGHQSGKHIRHFVVQRVDHLAAEAVGMLELHHSPALPFACSGGPGSRSITTTSHPRRASAMAVNRPVGPAPMMTVRTGPPNLR